MSLPARLCLVATLWGCGGHGPSKEAPPPEEDGAQADTADSGGEDSSGDSSGGDDDGGDEAGGDGGGVDDAGGSDTGEPPVELDLEAALASIPAIALTCVDVRAAYLTALSHGDDSCTGSPDQIPPEALLGCTASTGWSYAGVGEHTPLAYEDGTPAGFALVTDFTLEDPEGRRFRAGGDCTAFWEGLESGRRIASELRGTWVDETVDGPLALGLSGYLSVVRTAIPPSESSSGIDSLQLDGGFSIGDKLVVFEDFVWDGEACRGAPSGGLQLHDGRSWLRLTFDATCDGCGSVTASDGRELGRACPNLVGVIDTLRVGLPLDPP